MPNVSEVMSTNPQVLAPSDSLRVAATLMQTLDIGALPICDGRRLVGMLTDRDIAVRGVASGLDSEARVSEIMTRELSFCTADQDTEEVMKVMSDQQVRRLPVIDTEHRLVGIVALADLALRQSGHIDKTVRAISKPEGEADAPASGQAGDDGVLSGAGAGTSPKDSAPH